MNSGFLTGIMIDKRKIAAVTLLNLGTLSWFFILNSYMDEVFAAMTPNNPTWGFYVGNPIFIGFAIFLVSYNRLERK